jgi:hypothetical protein
MSAREIITEVLEWEFGEAADDQADDLLVILHDAGYRILGPGELDAETLERCVKELNKLPWFEDVVSLVDVEDALRALKDTEKRG